jgi:hypothetical protein
MDRLAGARRLGAVFVFLIDMADPRFSLFIASAITFAAVILGVTGN